MSTSLPLKSQTGVIGSKPWVKEGREQIEPQNGSQELPGDRWAQDFQRTELRFEGGSKGTPGDETNSTKAGQGPRLGSIKHSHKREGK